jgi:uncharacterized membrane protein YbhN (UPF0104 family)
VFSSAADAPRSRRPTDILLAGLMLLVLLVLWWPAPGPSMLDQDLAEFLTSLTGVWEDLWSLGFALLVLWPLTVLLLALVRRGRRGLLLDVLVAVAVALGAAILFGELAGTDWSKSLEAIAADGPPQVYVGVRLALAMAVVATASPHLSRPFRLVGRAVLFLGAVSTIAVGVAYPIGIAAGLAVGLLGAACAHLIFGSPGGQLTAEQVAEALVDLDLAATDVRLAAEQVPGAALFEATAADGGRLLIKVYGRDAWDSQFLASLWTSLVMRGERPHVGRTRTAQLEHEAVATLMAERLGAAVLPIVTVGETSEGDALLVTRLTGRRLAAMPADEVGDATVAAAWRTLASLHASGISHGRVNLQRIFALDDGGVALADLGEAELAADEDDVAMDDARLLVATATAVGHPRAVAVALAELGPDGMAAALPFLQPAALDTATRKAVREGDWALDQLRDAAAEAAGVEPPPLERLRRVSLKGAVFTVLGTLLAYYVITSLADVDWSEISDDFKGANWALIGLGLLLSPFVQASYSFGTMGASIKRLRYLPVLMLQYAIQFLAVVAPATAARLALEVRFFQRFGLAAAAALSIGLVDSVSGFVVQVLLLLVIGLSSLPGLTEPINTGDSSSSDTSSSSDASSGASLGEIALILLAAAVVAFLIALLIPKTRARIKARIPAVKAQFKEQGAAARRALVVLRHPDKVALMLGGNLGAQVIQAVILGVCLAAFGSSAHLSQLILINTLVSLFAGLMPVPGGVGVAEAGYTAGLQAIGVPSSVAISTALAFRLVTFYLPPIWGGPAMAWLRRREYV